MCRSILSMPEWLLKRFWEESLTIIDSANSANGTCNLQHYLMELFHTLLLFVSVIVLIDCSVWL